MSRFFLITEVSNFLQQQNFSASFKSKIISAITFRDSVSTSDFYATLKIPY
jgi:hypothetical protein